MGKVIQFPKNKQAAKSSRKLRLETKFNIGRTAETEAEREARVARDWEDFCRQVRYHACCDED